jgi:hypothetical protein
MITSDMWIEIQLPYEYYVYYDICSDSMWFVYKCSDSMWFVYICSDSMWFVYKCSDSM